MDLGSRYELGDDGLVTRLPAKPTLDAAGCKARDFASDMALVLLYERSPCLLPGLPFVLTGAKI